MSLVISNSVAGVYARISSEYNWIRGEVCKRSSSPPSSFQCEDLTRSITEPIHHQSDHSTWKILYDEDFKSGYGLFESSARSAVYYKSAKDRIGVIRMKAADLSLYSHPISVHSKEVQVTFSVNFPDVLEDENFCLDYSLDDGSSWQEQKCWIVADNFESDVWYSTSEVFPSNGAEKLIFRFRGSSSYLLDQVQIFGSDP